MLTVNKNSFVFIGMILEEIQRMQYCVEFFFCIILCLNGQTDKHTQHFVRMFVFVSIHYSISDEYQYIGSVHSILKWKQLNKPATVCFITVNQTIKEKEKITYCTWLNQSGSFNMD